MRQRINGILTSYCAWLVNTNIHGTILQAFHKYWHLVSWINIWYHPPVGCFYSSSLSWIPSPEWLLSFICINNLFGISLLPLTWTSIPDHMFPIFPWLYQSLLQITDTVAPKPCLNSERILFQPLGKENYSYKWNSIRSMEITILKVIWFEPTINWFGFFQWRCMEEKLPKEFEI